MNEYKVEILTHYSKMTLDKNNLTKDSILNIQNVLDKYSQDGWMLASTDAVSFGSAIYTYLYFKK
jgi:hypothetical protein